MLSKLQENQQLWWAAIKLPMYSVAIMPILLGSLLALFEKEMLYWDRLGLFLIAAVLILAWENLSNDVFDDETGIDKNKFHSVVQLVGDRSRVFFIANLLFLLGISCIALVVWLQQDVTVLEIILLCCVLGYCYQGPPFRLGYQGLGEILCFLAFGPLAIGAAYYSQTQSWHWGVTIPALVNGISTTLILFCSHFHQIEDDRKAGKLSPIVRLGTARSAQLIPWICSSIYGITVLGVMSKILPVECLAIGISLPWAINLCQKTTQYHDQPLEIRNCKFIAVGVHFWSNVGIILGLVVAYAL